MKFVLKTLPLLGTLLLSIGAFAQEAPKAPIEPKPSLAPRPPRAPIAPSAAVSNTKNDTVIIKLPNGKQMMMVAYGTNLVELSANYDLGNFINQLDATLIKSVEPAQNGATETVNYTRNSSSKGANGLAKDTSIELSISMNSPAESNSKVNINATSKKKIVTVITSNNQLKSLLDSLQNAGVYDFQVRTSADGTRYLISSAETENPSKQVFNSSYLQVNVKKSKSTSDSCGPCKAPAPFRRFFDFELDLGLNNYLGSNGQLPSDNSNYALSPVGSRYVALRGQYNFSWKISQKGNRRFVLSPGLEVQWYNFMFRNQVVLQKEGSSNSFNKGADVGFPNIEKSKLTASYLNIPVNFEIQNIIKDVKIGASFYGGYLLDAYTKVKYTKADGEETKDRYRQGNYNVNSFQYGFKGYINIEGVELFYRQNLTQLFKGDPISPELTPVAIGITL
jgi:hypothetical protein